MASLLAEESMKEFNPHEVIEGTVVLVNRDEAYVDIGYKTEIPIAKKELAYEISNYYYHRIGVLIEHSASYRTKPLVCLSCDARLSQIRRTTAQLSGSPLLGQF